MSIFDPLRRRFMLSCEDCNQFLLDYLEDTMDPRTRARFERHLSKCARCQAYLDQYRSTVDLVRSSGATEPPEAPEQLVEYTLAFLRGHLDRPAADENGKDQS